MPSLLEKLHKGGVMNVWDEVQAEAQSDHEHALANESAL